MDAVQPGDWLDPTKIGALPLELDDIQDLREALTEAGLPVDDLTLPGRRFFRFDAQHETIGFGGLEGVEEDFLLRSVVVSEPWRGRGVGQAIVRHLEVEASRIGAARLHILTTTAGRFFQRLSYAPTARGLAPPAIATTRQFTSLCLASADYLVKHLETF